MSICQTVLRSLEHHHPRQPVDVTPSKGHLPGSVKGGAQNNHVSWKFGLMYSNAIIFVYFYIRCRHLRPCSPARLYDENCCLAGDVLC